MLPYSFKDRKRNLISLSKLFFLIVTVRNLVQLAINLKISIKLSSGSVFLSQTLAK